MSGGSETGIDGARLGTVLLLLLLLLSLAGFTITRSFRVRDDVVNTVVLSERIAPGERARISFNTTLADDRADVLITDTEDRQIRALLLGGPLPAGPHQFSWDGIGDDGAPVPEGEYGIRVILGENARDIKPPGRIEVAEQGG